MKPKVISIIGGKGKTGSKFAKEFRKKGYTVLISDKKTKITNIEAARKGDVVIITVPIRVTEKVIREVAPYVRKDAMLTDFTSVKYSPVNLMRKYSKAEVIGGHPIFGPTTDFKNQKFILCPGRIKKYFSWYKSFLKSLGLKIIVMSPKEHDKQMGVIQCLIHLSNLSLAYSLKNLNYKIKDAEKLSSPVYLLRLYITGRILAQDPKLYSDIEIDNASSKQMANVYLNSVKKLNKLIISKDRAGFEKAIIDSKKTFGKITKKSMRITDDIISYMSKKQ